MTEPTPAELDLAVLDAGAAYAKVLQNSPDDTAAVDAAEQALEDANAARGYV